MKLGAEVVPESIKRSANKELHEMHDLCQCLNMLTIAVDPSNSIKDIERFIKKRLRSQKDIAVLKGPQYYMIMKQQTELKAALGEEVTLEDFIEAQEQEEIVHTLTEAQPSTVNPEPEEGVAPQTFHFERAKSEALQFPPLPATSPAKPLGPSRNIGYRFFFNGEAIKNKRQSLFDLVSQASAVFLFKSNILEKT